MKSYLMDPQTQDQFLKAIQHAQQALKLGKKNDARDFANQAVLLNPTHEEPWLILAAASSPKQSIAYLNKALIINPKSRRARKEMHWAIKHLSMEKVSSEKSKKQNSPPIKTKSKIKEHDRSDLRWVIPLFLVIVLAGLGVFYFFGFAVIKIQAADIIEKSKPEEIISQSILTSAFLPTPNELLKVTPFELPTATPTFIPKPLPTEYPTFPLIPPKYLVAEKSFITYAAHSWDIPGQVSDSTDFWIEVDLSQQMLFAYEGNNLLSTFSVSTGTRDFPTVTGSYKIYAKYPAYTMIGPGYNLPNVPYSMFFYKGYSIHGTYWHHNFGTPMSHGCVNMETKAAAWVYAQAKIGTNVFVHY